MCIILLISKICFQARINRPTDADFKLSLSLLSGLSPLRKQNPPSSSHAPSVSPSSRQNLLVLFPSPWNLGVEGQL